MQADHKHQKMAGPVVHVAKQSSQELICLDRLYRYPCLHGHRLIAQIQEQSGRDLQKNHQGGRSAQAPGKGETQGLCRDFPRSEMQQEIGLYIHWCFVNNQREPRKNQNQCSKSRHAEKFSAVSSTINHPVFYPNLRGISFQIIMMIQAALILFICILHVILIIFNIRGSSQGLVENNFFFFVLY